MAKPVLKLIPVGERALLARLNRALSKEDQMLKKTREDSRWYHDLGDYALVELSRNQWVDTHVDLEVLGREKGVLKNFEQLIKD